MDNQTDVKFQEKVEKQFYVYIFKCLKNEKFKYYWHNGKREEHETTLEDLDEYSNALSYSERAFDFSGYLVGTCSYFGIENALLFDAMMHLPENYREVITMAYFFNYTDSEIGQIMNQARSTIAYWRVRAMEIIKRYMEEHCDEN